MSKASSRFILSSIVIVALTTACTRPNPNSSSDKSGKHLTFSDGKVNVVAWSQREAASPADICHSQYRITYISVEDTKYVLNNMADVADESLGVDIGSNGQWLRFWHKMPTGMIGHVIYRDVDGDGVLDRVWKSQREDPRGTMKWNVSVIGYFDIMHRKPYTHQSDFGIPLTPKSDLFPALTTLPKSTTLGGQEVEWSRMDVR